MINLIFCYHCYTQLAKSGEIAVNVYEDVCEYYIVYKRCPKLELTTNGKKHPLLGVINYLEKKGYFITTDCGENEIMIKPLGISLVSGDYLICSTQECE